MLIWRVCKGSIHTQCHNGAYGMLTAIEGVTPSETVKIAMLDINLQHPRVAMGVQVIVKDPVKIESIKTREMDITKEQIKKIIQLGASIVLTTNGVDNLCMNYFVEAGILYAHHCGNDDLK